MPCVRKFWIVLLPVALLGGCRKSAQSQTHEALVKEVIVSVRNSASSLNSVTDRLSKSYSARRRTYSRCASDWRTWARLPVPIESGSSSTPKT